MSRDEDGLGFVVRWLRRKSSTFMRRSLGAVNPNHAIKNAEMYALAAGMLEDLAKRVPRWISVEERMPEGEVLAANFATGTYGYKEYIIGYVFPPRVTEPGGYYAENDYETLHDVTHWMPLPEPPKEEKEDTHE